MKHLRVVACMIMLALAGCDNNDKTAPTTKSEAPAVAQPSPAQDPAQLQKLAQQSQGKALTLLDASEAQLDGAATLVLTFSIPLDPEQDFSRVVHVVDKKSGSVDGAWELAPNLKELRLRHLEPERVLVVTVDPAVKALNNATFGKSYEKTITTRDVQPSVGFASRGSLLPGKIAEGLPVMALNVNHVDVNFFRVKPGSLASFVSQWEYRSSLSNWESDNLLKMADLVYTGRFDLNPARNTREKLLLPLSDIKPLQQAGVYVAVMNQAGHYNYSNAATLFTLSDIGVSAHRYHNRLDIFTQSLENGAAQSGIEIVLLNDKGQTLAQATSDAQGHVQLEADKAAALLLARKEEQTTLLDLTLPALDLSEFNVAGAPGYSKQFFMFGPRDLYRPGETVILNGLLRDSDGKTLPDQPVKLEVVKPDGQVMRTVVSQPENGLYRLNYPLDINAPTGLWHVRANTGDNLLRSWDFHVEDFMPERMALNLTAQKTPLAPADEVKFSVVGYYLYGAPANGNTLQGQLFLRPLRDAVAALPGFQFGNIAEENLSRSLDEVQLTLDKGGRGEVSAASQWQEAHSPLQVILQASLLESGGRPVTRRVEQAIWPADTLPGIRPQFAAKAVYDYRTDTTVNQPIVDEDSNAAFDIVYANAQGEKKAVSGLQVRLIRERRDYYWNWSESEGWQSQFDQKDLVEGEQTLDLNADETGKVSFPVEWGAYRLEVKAPNETVSSVRFWAGYSWQDNSDGSGAARPDRVTLKLDKANYRPGDTMKLHIAAPVAGKGYAMVESSDGPLWWQAIDVPAQGLELTIPVDKTWNRHDLYLSTLVVRPGDKSRSATPKRAVGLLHLPLGDENRRLDLALESPAKMRPNQPLTVRVKASVKHGEMPKQINVLVSAVDSGVLNITDYATPDPWQAFFGQKRYGADIYDIYGQVIEGQGRLAALRFGGDGDDLKRGGKPPLNLARYIRELKAYPYGCLEQTTSGLFPALYTNAAQLQSLGITGDSDEKRRAAVDIGISRILQMQRDNGGFALWDENGAEEPWLTAYAMDFLIRAGEQGYSVPPEAINRGNERLLRYLQDPGTMLIRYSDNTQASTFAAQAYAALVLARQQKAPLGALREIWERRSQAASGLPLMQLGIALNTMGDARRGEEAITLALNTPRQDERQWIADYGSSLRDNALMLSLLEENNLRPDAQNTLLSSLSEQAFGQRWLSTQENNALFLAAHSRQASAGAWQAQTSLEAQPLSGDKALTRNLDADQLAALEVTNTGSQPLWLRLDSSGYPSSAPEPASNVLQIERQILGTDGQRKSLSSLRSGELVLVWLTVVADRNVPDALVVDLLPAGLELENQNLADSSASLPESGSEVQNLLNQMQQADIQYMEFRDDRFVAAVVVNEGQPVTLVYLARAVTPGTYQLAQPQVESMYAPQWRATGASEGLLIVTP
ncbi:alpha-2-macroglobulin family protein [Salmonella enterica subsp. enterica serovar Agbeni]|nr:alpha-2-macroglobulin family protein [Salmonella enterica subsp. enterica serovar Agbeni]